MSNQDRGNEVNKEQASARTATTMRWLLAGAGLLGLVLTIAAACMISSDDKANAAVIQWYIVGLIGIVGVVVIGGTFAKMNRGIRQQNLKAIGITLIAVLVVVLAIQHEGVAEAAIGLLGAIAGYLFGKDSSSDDEEGAPPQNTGSAT